MHRLGLFFIKDRKIKIVQCSDLRAELRFILRKRLILHMMAFQHMGTDQDALAFQDLLGNGAGSDKRRGDPAAEMSSAPKILIAEIFFIRSVIRM